MLDVILQILAVLGIGLLLVLGLALAVLLLVLFFPVAYRASGRAQGKDVTAFVNAFWLFGLFRLHYAYPAQGQNGVKFLWMTIFSLDGGRKGKQAGGRTPDAAQQGSAGQDGGAPESGKAGGETPETRQQPGSETSDAAQQGSAGQDEGAPEGEKTGGETSETRQQPGSETSDAAQQESAGQDGGKAPDSETEASPFGEEAGAGEKMPGGGASWLSEKRKKLQYTICGFYDKIRGIWQNISYYGALLQERETRELFSHIKKRLWRILKSIRPRKLNARVRFGTGAPDTTGYAFGVYGMFQPLLGPGVTVLPDFEQAVFEAEFSAAGHMTVAAFARNILGVLLDKRLWKFKNKLFAGAGKRGNGGKNGR